MTKENDCDVLETQTLLIVGTGLGVRQLGLGFSFLHYSSAVNLNSVSHKVGQLFLSRPLLLTNSSWNSQGPAWCLAQMGAPCCVGVITLVKWPGPLCLQCVGWCQDTAGVTPLSCVPQSEMSPCTMNALWGYQYRCRVTADKPLNASEPQFPHL